MNPAAQVFQYTMIKHQMGVNAGLVYNVLPNLHIDLDFFRAEALWYLVNGLPQQKQVVWVGNAGMTQLVAEAEPAALTTRRARRSTAARCGSPPVRARSDRPDCRSWGPNTPSPVR